LVITFASLPVMLELAAAQMEKGIFELKLEGEGPRWARFFVNLGANKVKILALVFVVAAAFLNLTIKPAAFFYEMGWADSTIHALRIQAFVKWLIAGTGLVIWLVGFMVRKEQLLLQFDKGLSKLFYRYHPQFNLATVDEGEATFEAIRRIEVFAPHKEPRTPHGYIELEVYDAQEQREKTFRFSVLSEDQFKIYPTNLGRITGRDPKGDWEDPDSLPQGT
jgi:hypothetical protein